MTYTDELHALAGDTEQQVLDVFDQYTAGDLAHDAAVATIALLVARANARAVTLADLALAATLMIQTGKPVATLGLLPHSGDLGRLTKSANTLLGIPDVTPERVRRLGRVEPLDAAAKAWSDGVKKSPLVTGWVRGTHGTKCQLCQWWSRDGQVWSSETPIQRHKGCSCTQIPVNNN